VDCRIGYVEEKDSSMTRVVDVVIAPLAIEFETLHLLVVEIHVERNLCQFQQAIL
jgi:hypothetical protein